MNQKKLRKKLWPFFNRSHDGRHRYVARSLDGGPGWGVYDRLGDRFLGDAEVLKLPQDDLMLATVTH
jgi:hypothetical protein